MKIPKTETLIIFVFFACVALWAVSKCSSERADFVRKTRDMDDGEKESQTARRDTVAAQQTASPPASAQNPATTMPQPPPPVTTMPTLSNNPSPKASRPVPSNSPAQSPNDNYSTLYVTIDDLNVRKEPGLKSETIAKLKLYEPVTFLNEKTNWTQEISLGHEKVADHWVKIRTQSGKEGWVFGAGVHYYKMKRQGVAE